MKFEAYSEYDPRATSQTLLAFLTVWPGLGHYHEDLVLLKAAHFICGPIQASESADTWMRRLQVRQDMTLAAATLLRSF